VIGVILTALGTVQLKSLGLFEKRKPSAADVETRAVRQKKTENIVADIALGAYPQLGSHETSSPPSNTTRRYDVPRNEIRNYT
jgi:hypothetical protein